MVTRLPEPPSRVNSFGAILIGPLTMEMRDTPEKLAVQLVPDAIKRSVPLVLVSSSLLMTASALTAAAAVVWLSSPENAAASAGAPAADMGRIVSGREAASSSGGFARSGE